VHLDVRAAIRRGEEPLRDIMATVKALTPDEVLVVRAPFDPAPLRDVLARRGFAHWIDRRATDDWTVWFYREAAAPPVHDPTPASGLAATAPAQPRSPATLDVRGLEPPLPMVRILEAIEQLGPGDRLEVLHDRRPMFLYPQLDDRGFVHETQETAGLVRIQIRREGPR
jgi:uncharacterized protein (DUF2249 family)